MPKHPAKAQICFFFLNFLAFCFVVVHFILIMCYDDLGCTAQHDVVYRELAQTTTINTKYENWIDVAKHCKNKKHSQQQQKFMPTNRQIWIKESNKPLKIVFNKYFGIHFLSCLHSYISFFLHWCKVDSRCGC